MNAIDRFSLQGETQPLGPDPETNTRHRAVLAQGLFIANLTILPGVGFAALFMLWLRHRHDADLAAIHLEQALFTTLWAGAIVLGTVLVTIQLGGTGVPLTWAILLPALVLIQATLIVLGIVALTRANSGKAWRYPVLGPLMPETDSEKH